MLTTLIMYKKFNVYLLGISIFLIRLPPFYFLPIKNSLFMSHTLARVFILITFIGGCLFLIVKKEKNNLPKILQILLIVWFISQSSSIIAARHMGIFLDAYKDIVFAILIFLSTIFTVKRHNIDLFMKILLFATIIHLLFQLFSYLYPNIMYSIFGQIIYEPYWQFFHYQYQRDRFFGDTLDESMIPLLFYFLTGKEKQKKAVNKLTAGISLFLISFITFVSNWRSKLVIYFFSLLSSISIFKIHIRKIIVFGAIGVLFILFANIISLNIIGQNIVDRIAYPEKQESESIIARYNFWEEATEIGLSSPIIGVGLGNYYDNLSSKSRELSKSSIVNTYESFITIDDPHNIFFSIFATTGLFGLISFILLTGYFFYTDYKIYLKNQYEVNSLIIIYWSIFIFSLLNPWLYFSYLTFIWFIRGSIESLKINYEN